MFTWKMAVKTERESNKHLTLYTTHSLATFTIEAVHVVNSWRCRQLQLQLVDNPCYRINNWCSAADLQMSL